MNTGLRSRRGRPMQIGDADLPAGERRVHEDGERREAEDGLEREDVPGGDVHVEMQRLLLIVDPARHGAPSLATCVV